jgi:hypothetical protein
LPRIRSIKPDFFTSEDVSALPLRARLTWIGLWTQCDDHGRTKDTIRLIKAALWPLDDVGLSDVEQDLVTLADHGRIVRYEVDGKGFLAVVNWHVHQAISKAGKARHPAPPLPVNPTDPHAPGYCADCARESPGVFPEPSRTAPGALPLGKEGKGKEGTRARDAPGTLPERSADPEPPLRCPKHEHDPAPPPCGACADARRTHDAWQQRRRDRPTPTASSPPCPRHPDQPASHCPACAAEAAPAPDLRALRRSRSQESA